MTDISFDAANYLAIRHALIDLHQRIIKKPNPFDVKTCARHLGLLNKKTLNFRNNTEVDLLPDQATFDSLLKQATLAIDDWITKRF